MEDFIGWQLGQGLATILILLGLAFFFGLIFKIIQGVSNATTKATGKDPKSMEGEKRASTIGFILLGIVVIFALFIAPNLRK
jgi:hypothetical protein